MDVHPGPLQRDVLVLAPGEHRCDVVWQNVEIANQVLKCHRLCSSLYSKTLVVDRPPRVREILRDYGFHGVERIGGLQLDWALITSLVERWRPETHAFHLPFGEVGITLQDVEVLLGLPVDGIPLSGITGRSTDHWIQICEDMMGFRPAPADITSSTIRISAIIPKTLTARSGEVDYLQHTRAIMFKLLGGSLFPNTSGSKVSLYLLEILMGGADNFRKYAIGSAVLSFLYRSMCRASLRDTVQIGGCLILLQLWAWERLPMTRPRGVTPLDRIVDFPYGVRWVCYHRWSDCTTHSLRAYRDQLDRMLETEFVWMPYPPPPTLPEYCSAGIRIWTSRIPLIFCYIVEMHYPDRFCRQFGGLQDVPQPVVYDRHLHNMRSSVMVLGEEERHYLEEWEGRYAAMFLMQFAVVDATPQYRAWFHVMGRRQMGNPSLHNVQGYVPITPELKTALSCIVDCRRRLDPARHEDGFVPTHEVIRVRELLTECVHALGQASLLDDHPQEEQVANPLPVRRRVDRRQDRRVAGIRRGGRGSRRVQVEEEDAHNLQQSPPLTADDDESNETPIPYIMGEASTSYHPHDDIEPPRPRMFHASPVPYNADMFSSAFFTQESQITNEEAMDEEEEGGRPRRQRRGTRCGTGSHYV